jgi:hypothetical protein
MSDQEKSLQEKIREWLANEGYPLEFRTGLEFLKQGFSIRHGEYVKGAKEGLREVDVVAYETSSKGKLRVYYVVECKWSGDKPWIVFTSETESMAESACVNQTIASLLGRSAVWILAGDPKVAALGMFECPSRPGFSGRQAFTKGNDLFYAAVQSVVSKARSLVDEYDMHSSPREILPEWCVLAFPVVVVDGGLFEGYMDWGTGEIAVEPAKQLRVHWRGSEAWEHRATVDIVTADHAGEYARIRARDTSITVL